MILVACLLPCRTSCVCSKSLNVSLSSELGLAWYQKRIVDICCTLCVVAFEVSHLIDTLLDDELTCENSRVGSPVWWIEQFWYPGNIYRSTFETSWALRFMAACSCRRIRVEVLPSFNALFVNTLQTKRKVFYESCPKKFSRRNVHISLEPYELSFPERFKANILSEFPAKKALYLLLNTIFCRSCETSL